MVKFNPSTLWVNTSEQYYIIYNKKAFCEGVHDISQFAENCADFAFKMTLGGVGEHRDNRSGGDIHRDKFQQFQNVFQGKMGEYAVWNYLIEKGFDIKEPDMTIYGSGKYDKYDLIVNEKTLSIKSAMYKAQLLLLEKKDYNEEGLYIPNINKGCAEYNFFVFCRIKPNIKTIFRSHADGNEYTLDSLMDIIKECKWESDLPGFITRENLVYLINNSYIIPKNGLLNRKIKMDADNYYCQAGDLHDISSLCSLLQQ